MTLEDMFPDESVRALAKAAGEGDLPEINRLVESGVDVNARGTKNATPLFWSMRNLEGFKTLLNSGADPNVVFDDGGSVMHWSARHKNPAHLKLALRNGGNPDLVAGLFRETPIFETIGIFGEIGKNPALTALLDAGANINFKSSTGSTPAVDAASIGRFDLVYELLVRGVDYTLSDNRGRDLAYYVRSRRTMLDPNHELYIWLEKVSAWLRGKGVGV